ncbi:B12-binding domain-containing radical SAM protein [Geomonas anaerohicana]|uniref:B12-binding domain-containing radical SAM protein n=1 Tax=Geomonas anaerohicana TaxID=2798583 RepID=A0ABS0YC57_9BACT|nr:B12-binding domain-containing radical SAM protein [Geomonas anaerohicana]MBJ6749870.1 B12-binding domain-containing radical SAM protein [Geomonas anaerohicana]
MNVLLVYPRCPDTFWSFRHAMKFIGRKASFPPLGLLTVAAMLPQEWNKKLVDENVHPLSDRDLAWADYVFLSAMTVQRESALEVLQRCRRLGLQTVAGGPFFTAYADQFPDIDHLVLGEAELTLPPFLEDLKKGEARHLYSAKRRPHLRQTPIPLWDLIDPRDYAAMNIQYSRGCPFDCEFCDITALFGRAPRSKELEHLIAELDALYVRGWRGAVFLVDDNFIGDRAKLKRYVLPALVQWMVTKRYPFYFYTEASIDLADDGELMALMVRAGFQEVFIGIETPDEGGLAAAGKTPNRGRDLLESVKRIQRAGLQVHGGFIVGFDSDPATIFETQVRFIQQSSIATAMIGMLVALRGTRLYQRLADEGRLLGEVSGNNTAIQLNFVPRMKSEVLIAGYKRVLEEVYAPENYYQRVIGLLRIYRPQHLGRFHLQPGYIAALFKSMMLLGVVGRERYHFWKLFFWSLVVRPRLFPLAITYAVYGYHFRKVSDTIRES